MSVDSVHPDYANRKAEWDLMRTCERGEQAIKEAGATYLPMPNGFTAQADQGAGMYAAYKERARFLDLVNMTLGGMVGLIHRTEFKIEGLEEGKPLALLHERATPDGLTLTAFSQQITRELLLQGRYGVLVDAERQDESDPNPDAAPLLAGYAAETIINWSSDFDLYVLDETDWVRSTENGFTWQQRRRFRVLRLAGDVTENERGEQVEDAKNRGYRQEIWEEGKLLDETGRQRAPKKDETPPLTRDPEMDAVPVARGGDELGEIPFVVVGPHTIALDPALPPLIGVARAVKAAYQLDADYRHQLFSSGQETLFVSGADDKEVPTIVGAGVVHSFGSPQAKAEYVGPAGRTITLHKEAIAEAKADAVAAGAQLFDKTDPADESGRAKKMRYTAQTATLTSIALASAAALERALRYAALMVGQTPEEVIVTPNLEFVEMEMTPQEAQALVAVWQSGAIAYETFYENLQRGRIASQERTAQEEQELIDQEAPDEALPGGDLGGGSPPLGDEEGDGPESVTDEELAALFAPDVLEAA